MNINNLISILNKKNISRYNLSKMTGLSKGAISRIINEKNKDPRISTVKKIAKALDVDINELI